LQGDTHALISSCQSYIHLSCFDLISSCLSYIHHSSIDLISSHQGHTHTHTHTHTSYIKPARTHSLTHSHTHTHKQMCVCVIARAREIQAVKTCFKIQLGEYRDSLKATSRFLPVSHLCSPTHTPPVFSR